MKIIKRIITLPQLAKKLSLEMIDLLAICEHEEKISPYRLVSSRTDPSTKGTVHIVDSVDLQRISQNDSAGIAIIDELVFDTEQVKALLSDFPELLYVANNQNKRADYFDAIIAGAACVVPSDPLEATTSNGKALATSTNSGKMQRPTISAVQRLRDEGIEMRKIANMYPDFFNFDATRELPPKEWEVVRNRIYRFLQGRYKGGRR